MESLVLFDSVVNSRWFMRTSIILFLNKVDLFKAKLARSPLGKYFPDYSGGNDVNRAAKYLLWRFNQVNRAHLNTSNWYIKYPTGLCCSQRNNSSECPERFRHSVMVAPETLIRIPTLPEEHTSRFLCIHDTHTSLPPTVGKNHFPRHSASTTTNQSSPVLSEYAYFIHRPDLRIVYYFSLSSAALESRSFMGFIRESTC